MRNRKVQKLLGILLVWGFSLAARAQVISGDAANSWLRISPSTRNSAMGESLGATPGDIDALDINPAELGYSKGDHISFSQNFWPQGLSLSHLVYDQSLSNGNGFSFGGDYVNFGSISNYTVTNSGVISNGSESPLGLNLYGGYGLNLGKGWRTGLALHVIYDNIQPHFPDQTLALDGGLGYELPGTPLALSVVLSDLGWNLDESSLPVQLKTAASWGIDFGPKINPTTHTLTLAAEADWSLISSTESSLGMGAEYWYQGLIALRAGYRFMDSQYLEGLTGLTLGAGIRLKDWQLDYALMTIGDFGTSNQIALSLKLGGKDKTTN